MNENTELARKASIAQFRFGLIAPVIQQTHKEKSDAAYFKTLDRVPLTQPDGKVVFYTQKTLQKWAALYRKYGFDALMPSDRADKGESRVLSDEAISEIFTLTEKYPRLNATLIHKRLVHEGLITADVSVCAVQRFIKRHDLRSARNPNVKDRRAFEEDAFGKMYQADTCYFPYITEDGKSRRVYCIAIIDDHSRLIVGAELFYNDNAENFQKVLKDAISTYGIPQKLLVDNGAPYANEQISLICGSLGIVLIHTKPRDAAAKGKCERHWRTMNQRWLTGLDIESITSIAQFNEQLRDYIREYNTTYHSGIDCMPIERYRATADQVKRPISGEWLDECFLNRKWRKVRKDSTIAINKKSYDAPQQFIGAKVEIRYRPEDMSSAFILYDDKKYPVRPTDKVANCRAKRSNPMSIDYSRAHGKADAERAGAAHV